MPSIFEFKNAAGNTPGKDDIEFVFSSLASITKFSDANAQAGADGQRRFSGVGYTGDPIQNHPYWGQVIFDLSKMSVPAKMPILRDHHNEMIVGFSDKNSITDKGLELEGNLTKSTPFGQEVINLSDEGFPWQMSVRIMPSSIEELRTGATAVVNNRSITGPAYIFRDSAVSETSFTPTGWDSKTTATALSRVSTLEEDNMSKELEDKVKALETQLAEMTASRDNIKAELDKRDAQIQASKEADIKAAFAKAGKEISAEAITAFSKLPQEAQDAVLGALKPAEVAKPAAKLPEGLFSEQASAGKDEAAPSDGKGLLALADASATSFAQTHHR